MRPFRLVAIGSTGFAVVAMLLPFASFPASGAVDGITADAWPALIPLLAVTIVLMATGWEDDLEAGAASIVVVCAGAALVFSVVKVTDSALAARAAAGASMGPGSIVLAVASAVATGAVAAGVLAAR